MSISQKKKKYIQRRYPQHALRESGLDPAKKSGPGKAAGKNSEARLKIVMAGLIFCLAVIAYLPGIKNGFIYDDKFQILRNPQVTGDRPVSEIFAREFYRTSEGKSPYYRPLVNLSYRLDYGVWKDNPLGYHLTNIIIHGLVSVLVFLCLLTWLKKYRTAAAAGLIFALHPAHTQSVSWISGRTDLLSSLFVLLAVYFYLRAQERDGKWNWKWFGLSLTAFLPALLCKEVAVTALVLIALLDFGKATKIKAMFQARRIFAYAGWIGIILIYFLIRLKVLGFLVGYQAGSPVEWYYRNLNDLSRLATVFKVYGYYLQTLLAPIHLSFESKMPVSGSWLDPYLAASATAVLLLSGVGIISLKYFPELAVAVFWFLVTLLPVSNIFPGRELAMEHLLYLPSVGFCLGAALALEYLDQGIGRSRNLIRACLGIILAGFLALTGIRQAVWKDEVSFWKDAAIKAPLKRRPWYNLGGRLKDRGDEGFALRCWTLAEQAEPDNPEVHNNLGAALLERGEIDPAVREFQEALRLNPNHPRAKINLETALNLKLRTGPENAVQP